MSISKIIHHIAPADRSRWHPMWERCYPSWQEHFPEFEHKMWNDKEDIDNIVREYYPQYYDTYMQFPLHIMKIDFARFCILHQYGGIYADMDMFCYKNFYDELNKSLYILQAPYGDVPVENALMISQLNHEFWLKCMDKSVEVYNNLVKPKISNINLTRSLDQLIITSAAGPRLVFEVIKTQPNTIDFLPGVLYNNHGLSYHTSFRTKHMLTGIWGRETLDMFDGGDGYIEDLKQYGDITGVTLETFDFYKDYTNGGYLTASNNDLRAHIRLKKVEFHYE